MRKLFFVVLAITLLCGGVVYAANDYAVPNPVIVGSTGGQLGYSPATQIVRVRYGYMNSTKTHSALSSGDIVIWDTNSSDGITVRGPEATYTTGDGRFAGVLVSSIGTADTGAIDPWDDNWGWIAVKGYCLASVDAAITVGGVTCGIGVATTGGLSTMQDATMSRDVASLLKTTTAAGLAPVWIR